METSNWRFQLQAASRKRMVKRIMVTLKRHLPFSGQEGLEELNKIAVRFEEKIYTAATSLVDYLQKISLKMQIMEPRLQNPMPAAQAQGSQVMQQVNIQGQPLPIRLPSNYPHHYQQRQQLLSLQTMHNNIISTGMQGDWRAQLQPDSRQRIVNKIMDTLKRHLPDEGLSELKKMADKFEDEIYTAATSLHDYLRKISLKMVTMGTRSQKSISVANSVNPSVELTGSQVMQQVNIQGFPLPIRLPFNHPQQGQLLSSQTMHNNIISNGKQAIDDSSFNIMESGDWRAQLQPDSRQMIVNKILDTLKRHLPFSGHEGLHELVKIAVRFEEKIYTAATSQSDYLRMISLKMLSMESRSSQNPIMPGIGVGPHFQ